MQRFKVYYLDITTNEEYSYRLYYNSLEDCKKDCPNSIRIEIYNDFEYLKYIDKIKEKCEFINEQVFNESKKREIYKLNKNNSEIFIRIGIENGLILDFAEYRINTNDVLGNDIVWTLSNPKTVYELFIDNDEIQMREYSFRTFSMPKLSKPKKLKGIKQSFSVDFIPKKCKCGCFIKDNDLYIKHRDYFSPSLEVEEDDFDKPLEYLCNKYIGTSKKSKFCYPDSWGDIVLRNEAWIEIKNIIPSVKIMNSYSMGVYLYRLFENMNKDIMKGEYSNTWSRFWDNVAMELYRFELGVEK